MFSLGDHGVLAVQLLSSALNQNESKTSNRHGATNAKMNVDEPFKEGAQGEVDYLFSTFLDLLHLSGHKVKRLV